jgi:hypothetical protein
MFEIGKVVSKSMEADSLIFSIYIDFRVDLFLKLALRSFCLDGQTLVLPKPNGSPEPPRGDTEVVVCQCITYCVLLVASESQSFDVPLTKIILLFEHVRVFHTMVALAHAPYLTSILYRY